MVSILAVIHIILCILVVVLVLIQDPKGGASGGIFGGGGGADSLFGANGAPSFLAKITRYVAIVFAISCLAMTIATKPSSNSVLDSASAPKAETATETLPEAAAVGTAEPVDIKAEGETTAPQEK